MKLEQLQQVFFDAILGKENSFSECVAEHEGINNAQRISIYQNAYFSRLKETIETDHEILGVYLGDDLFDEMAIGYIKTHPSQYKSLRFYSDKLPEFLGATAPFNAYPVIAELARFERFLLHAFDAAESARATLLDLQKINPNDWPKLRFFLHPSCQSFSTYTNCVECWQALKVKQQPPEATEGKTDWLIWRNEERLTEFLSLSDLEFYFFQSILRGNNFSNMCDQLSEFLPEEDVGPFAVNVLVTWLEKGIISRIQIL